MAFTFGGGAPAAAGFAFGARAPAASTNSAPTAAPTPKASFGFSRVFQGDDDIFTATDIATALLGQLALDAHVPGWRLPPLWPMIANAANRRFNASTKWVEDVATFFGGRVTTLDLTYTIAVDFQKISHNSLLLFNITHLKSHFHDNNLCLPKLEFLELRGQFNAVPATFVAGFSNLRVLRSASFSFPQPRGGGGGFGGGFGGGGGDDDDEGATRTSWSFPCLEEASLMLQSPATEKDDLLKLLDGAPQLTTLGLITAPSSVASMVAVVALHPVSQRLRCFQWRNGGTRFGFFGGFRQRVDEAEGASEMTTTALCQLLTQTPCLEQLALSSQVSFDPNFVLAAAPQRITALHIAPHQQQLSSLPHLANLHTLVLELHNDGDDAAPTLAPTLDIASFARRIVKLRLFIVHAHDMLRAGEFVHSGLTHLELGGAGTAPQNFIDALIAARPRLVKLALLGAIDAGRDEELLSACGGVLKAVSIGNGDVRSQPTLWQALGAHCSRKLTFVHTRVLCDGTAQVEDLLRQCPCLEQILCGLAWCTPIMQSALAQLTARRRLRLVATLSAGGFGYANATVFQDGVALPQQMQTMWQPLTV